MNSGGSTMGGNSVTIRGGPFLSDETSVDVDGIPAKIIALSEDEIEFAAPAENTGEECPGFGERGFIARYWDMAMSDVYQILG